MDFGRQFWDKIDRRITEIATSIVERRFGGPPELCEIVKGPDGSFYGDHQNQCWLRFAAADTSNDNAPPFKADNFVTPIRVGTKVWYGSNGRDPKKQVLGYAYDEPGLMANGETLTSVMRHGDSHKRVRTASGREVIQQGHDAVLIGAGNVYPFQVKPGSSGATISINPGVYFRDNAKVTFGGITDYALSSHIPGTANTQRYVAVWINLSDNSVNYTNGATTAVGVDRPADPSVTDPDALILAYVRCYNGQTSVNEFEDIEPMINLIGANSDTPSNVPYVNAGDGTQLTTRDSVAKSDNIQFQQKTVFGVADGDDVSNSARITVRGVEGSNTNGATVELLTDEDVYPIIQYRPFRHDNLSVTYDAYFDAGWKSSSINGNFQIFKGANLMQWRYQTGVTAGNAVSWQDGLVLSDTGRVGVRVASPNASIDADQSDATGAVPVLKLSQADLSEEFIRLVGESTTDASQSLVDAADLTTPGTIQGWIKIYVQDDASSGAITDGVYYVPFYSAPTA